MTTHPVYPVRKARGWAGGHRGGDAAGTPWRRPRGDGHVVGLVEVDASRPLAAVTYGGVWKIATHRLSSREQVLHPV